MKASVDLLIFGYEEDPSAKQILPFILETSKCPALIQTAVSCPFVYWYRQNGVFRIFTYGTVDEKRCQVLIDIPEGKTTLSSWYEVWEAVSAVASMCVRGKRKGGRSRGIGTHCLLDIEYEEHSRLTNFGRLDEEYEC